jgi:hypothetical protein
MLNERIETFQHFVPLDREGKWIMPEAARLHPAMHGGSREWPP